MSKGISEDAQIHISIAFLIKAMVAVAVVVGSWYQAQMQFADQKRRIEDLERKGTALDSEVTARALVFILAGHELHHFKIIKEAYIAAEDFPS